jgi:hypothetical protein
VVDCKGMFPLGTKMNVCGLKVRSMFRRGTKETVLLLFRKKLFPKFGFFGSVCAW